MEEYRIVQQIGNSKPYSLYTFNNFNDCYLHLLNLIQIQQSSVRKKYYVTNSFFNNKYPPFLDGIVQYTIEVREVNEWKEYKEEKVASKNLNKKVLPFRK